VRVRHIEPDGDFPAPNRVHLYQTVQCSLVNRFITSTWLSMRVSLRQGAPSAYRSHICRETSRAVLSGSVS
jgi:hypothetical protein